MKETFESRIAKASSLLDVLLLVKEKTGLDIHVASLCFVDEVVQAKSESNSYGIVRVKPFPLRSDQSEYSIYAYYFNNDSSFVKSDIVLVLFMDNNFINNLSSMKGQVLKTEDPATHSLEYGVIVSLK